MYGSIRIQKQTMSDKGIIRGNRYYKSYKQQMEHDFRIEKIEDGYLKRPQEKNKHHKFKDIDVNSIINDWIDIDAAHQKEHGKKIQKQTKPTITGLITFSSDFDLDEHDRQRQFDIVKGWIEQEFDAPIYVVQHNDEKSLHYHFSFMNWDNELKRPLGKRIDTSKLQDKVFNYLKEHNADYGHSRGVSKSISMKEHKSIMEGKVEEHKKELNHLQSQISSLQEEKFDLKSEIDKIQSINEESKMELQSILEDFEYLGLNYKGKTSEGLLKLFQRQYKDNSEEKITNLTNKIRNLVDKNSSTSKSNSSSNLMK